VVIVAALNIPLLYCSELNQVHSQLYSVYASKVSALLSQQFKDEDINGESNLLPGLVTYQMANILVTLFYSDFIKGENTIEELLKFYKIDELRECFRCIGIDLKLLFDTVGIDILADYGCVEGIESVVVEGSLQIEVVYCSEESTTSSSTGESVNLTDLINQNNSCTILIN
jgi:hypothetical protein